MQSERVSSHAATDSNQLTGILAIHALCFLKIVMKLGNFFITIYVSILIVTKYCVIYQFLITSYHMWRINCYGSILIWRAGKFGHLTDIDLVFGVKVLKFEPMEVSCTGVNDWWNYKLGSLLCTLKLQTKFHAKSSSYMIIDYC